MVGAIFAVQALGVCVGSLLAPTYALERLGAFGALRLATLAQALFTAAFCLVDRMSTAVPFAAACLAVRLLQGLACGLTETAAASLAMRSVPDRLLGDVFAWVAAARALGAVSGPPVGGAAFDWRGFAAPFTIAGGLLGALGLLMLVAGVRAGSAGGAGGPPSTGMASLLRVPGVVPALLSMHTALAALNFLMPTLQPFFHTAFALSSTQIGLAFLGVAVAYGAAIGASGPLSRAAGEAPQMVLGLALIALGYLLLGPSPILARWLPQTLAGSLGALAVGAAGMAMAMVPSTPLMIAAVSAWAAGDADRKQRAIDGLAALATVAGLARRRDGPRARRRADAVPLLPGRDLVLRRAARRARPAAAAVHPPARRRRRPGGGDRVAAEELDDRRARRLRRTALRPAAHSGQSVCVVARRAQILSTFTASVTHAW